MEMYKEMTRSIPIYGNYDVIVAGGGSAGAFAAIAAARSGAKTLVVERVDCLGGMITSGLMNWIWALNDKEKVVVKGIGWEFIEKVEAKGGVLQKGDHATDAFLRHQRDSVRPDYVHQLDHRHGDASTGVVPVYRLPHRKAFAREGRKGNHSIPAF